MPPALALTRPQTPTIIVAVRQRAYDNRIKGNDRRGARTARAGLRREPGGNPGQGTLLCRTRGRTASRPKPDCFAFSSRHRRGVSSL